MQASIDRIRNDIETICSFNATPGKGYTRFSYSPEDLKAREYLLSQFRDLGMECRIDPAGNIRARMEGSSPNAPAVMSGSHIDTVLHGGMFDGLVGTVGALEVARVLREQGIKPVHPYEVVVFVEEEGSNFGSTTAGSKAMVGRYGVEDLRKLKNLEGKSMFEAAKSIGLDPEKLPESFLKPGDLKAMVELHIEQSVVLDTEGLQIGIVEAIAGIRAYSLSLEGIPNHAGATPMKLRQDPLVGAAEVILEAERAARECTTGSAVGTIGRIFCEPNVSNVIPGKVRFTLDARDVKTQGMDEVVGKVRSRMDDVAAKRNLFAEMKLVGESRAIEINREMTDLIESAARKLGARFRRMNSGAVHDACLIADVAPIGMIFVPSINGRSHVPEENTNWPDIEMGANVLLETLLKLLF
jgi:allantoate deiminase